MLFERKYTTGQEKLVNSVTEYIGNIRKMLETHPMGETQIYLRNKQKKEIDDRMRKEELEKIDRKKDKEEISSLCYW